MESYCSWTYIHSNLQPIHFLNMFQLVFRQTLWMIQATSSFNMGIPFLSYFTTFHSISLSGIPWSPHRIPLHALPSFVKNDSRPSNITKALSKTQYFFQQYSFFVPISRISYFTLSLYSCPFPRHQPSSTAKPPELIQTNKPPKRPSHHHPLNHVPTNPRNILLRPHLSRLPSL